LTCTKGKTPVIFINHKNIAMQTAVSPVVKEAFINAPLSIVWKALTDKEQMKHWYFEVSDFKPVTGFEFSFWGENEGRKYLHLSKVMEVIENKKLSYSWRYEGFDGESLVTFELFEEYNGTRLKLTHEGLESFAGQHADFALSNFNEGWGYIIGTSIKEFAEKQEV
jgi:uncharacterized protein YndB with AHSA1/START domain